MSREVFVRGNGIFSQYYTTETLSPNTWTYVLMGRNQQYISVNGIMQLLRNRPQTQYTSAPKITRSKTETNFYEPNGTKRGVLCHKGQKSTN